MKLWKVFLIKKLINLIHVNLGNLNEKVENNIVGSNLEIARSNKDWNLSKIPRVSRTTEK